LKHLAGMTWITDIDLNDTQVTDAGLVHIRGLQELKYLRLKQTRITDEGLTHLSGLKKLGSLSLEGSFVTKEAADKFKKDRPDLYVTTKPRPREELLVDDVKKFADI